MPAAGTVTPGDGATGLIVIVAFGVPESTVALGTRDERDADRLRLHAVQRHVELRDRGGRRRRRDHAVERDRVVVHAEAAAVARRGVERGDRGRVLVQLRAHPEHFHLGLAVVAAAELLARARGVARLAGAVLVEVALDQREAVGPGAGRAAVERRRRADPERGRRVVAGLIAVHAHVAAERLETVLVRLGLVQRQQHVVRALVEQRVDLRRLHRGAERPALVGRAGERHRVAPVFEAVVAQQLAQLRAVAVGLRLASVSS